MKIRVKILLFCINCILFIACDRVTKLIARHNLIHGQLTSYFHDTFRLKYVENTSIAFKFADNLPETTTFWLLGVLPLCILAALFFFVIIDIKKMTLLRSFSFSLIIAGALGNIMDRIMYHRHVVVFMNIGINNLRTGIFNVADVCVIAGLAGLIIAYYKTNETVKTPETGARA